MSRNSAKAPADQGPLRKARINLFTILSFASNLRETSQMSYEFRGATLYDAVHKAMSIKTQQMKEPP